MLLQVRRRWLQLAVVALLAGGGLAACEDDATSVLLVFEVEGEAYRPEYILFNWRAPGGGGLDDARLPAQGVLPAAGRLGSVHIELSGDQPGEREVLARGLRGEVLVSAARGEIPWRPGVQTTVTLKLGCPGLVLADPAGCPPPAADAGAPDGAAPGPADAHGPSDAAPPPDQRSDEPGAEDARQDTGNPDGSTPADAPRPADAAPVDADAAGPPPGTRLADGLVLYFKMDERPSSSTAADSSGNGNLGTLANLDVSRAWGPGRLGQALQLPGGATPGWVSVTPAASLDRVSTGLTISAWVKATPTSAERSTILARRSVGAGGFLYSLHLLGDRPGFWLNSSHGARADATSARALPGDRWVHLALVHDHQQLRARLYQDGVVVAEDDSVLGFAPEVTPLLIGGSQGASPGSVIDPFAGSLDEVIVYDRTLNLAEVRALAAGFYPR